MTGGALAPSHEGWEQRVRREFSRQGFMHTLRAELGCVAPGRTSVTAAGDVTLSQQHGYVHAGVLATLADTSAGFAALTLCPAAAEILTVEFKINLLRPAVGRRVTASAHVLKHGRTLTICESRVSADAASSSGGEAICAVAIVTLMAVAPSS